MQLIFGIIALYLAILTTFTLIYKFIAIMALTSTVARSNHKFKLDSKGLYLGSHTALVSALWTAFYVCIFVDF